MKKLILSILTLSFAISAQAAQKKSLTKDFDTLGDNKVFVERVKEMDQDKRVRIVQNRIVDLYNRLEVAGNYGYNAGGDSYVTTQNLGGILDFHFSPKFAIGVRYQHFYNELTNEGKAQYETAKHAQSNHPEFAGVDFPKDSGLFTVSYSPIYGKLNLFDSGVAHFDIYVLGGYGKMVMDSGTTDVFTGGIGSGIWLTQNFSARLEARYENYKDLLGTFDRNQNNVQGMFAIGILL
jgi:outer membrane beta-barrel protein